MNINIEEYLSEEEIKEIVIEEVKRLVKNNLRDEENTKRILKNASYDIVFEEVDKIVPNSKQIIIDQVSGIISKMTEFSVFRDGSGYSPKSLAFTYIEESVKNNKELINDKVKETIINKDYSDIIWDKFEELGNDFINNIYEISKLGRQK